MDLQLTGKTALVSGSTAGIGYAIASLLAQEGAAVVVNGRTPTNVETAVNRIRQESPGAPVQGVAADLSSREGVERLTAAVPVVDILVNNLGFYEEKPFPEITDADWQRMLDVNVMSGVRLSRFYLPIMLQKNVGRVVFISSESGVNIPVEMIHYGVAKTAVIGLARGLAEMTAGTAVTVNSVLPGPTRSQGGLRSLGNLAQTQGTDMAAAEKEFFRSVRPSSLLQRMEDPQEVAALVVFVCSLRASGINGAALRVDGGVVRFIA